jgi:hypothetical protein
MKLEKDKQLHLIMSAFITFMCGVNISLLWGAIIGTSVGLFKEFVYDLWMKKGTFDKKDLLFNFIGVGAGMAAAVIIKLMTIYL